VAANRTGAHLEIVAQEHWGSSGVANTDLDLQLKKHGIHKLSVAKILLEHIIRDLGDVGVTLLRCGVTERSCHTV
jgi:ureidoacrylate peracid hydrolase